VASNIFGLMASDPNKGKLSLQTLAGKVLDPNGQPVTSDTYDGVPNTNPYTALPYSQIQASANAPQVAQVNAANLPANFQWTGEFDAANRGLQQQESDAGLKRNNSLQSIADTYLRATQEAGDTQHKSTLALAASMAGRGLLGSTPTLVANADLSTNYQKYLDKLGYAKAQDVAGVENNYASVLNNASRTRESLASQQQAKEEARRLAEAQAQAEAVRQQQEAEMRRQEIQQLVQAQQAAQAAAEQAAQAAAAASYSYNPPSFGGGGYDYGGGGYSAPQAAPVQQEEARVALPFNSATSNVPRSAVEKWVKTNIDPNLGGGKLNAVISALSNSGTTGLTRTQIAQIIANAGGGSPFAGVTAGMPL